jgi:tetratricopeptide (TPR) repeat protein
VKRAAFASVAALAATATAIAGPGSTRYPPEPFDADKAAEEHSDFWERALTPDRGRYDQLLAAARRLIDGKTPKDLADADAQLAGAIELLPDAPDAYYLRGWARELAQDWAGCADDYNQAAALDPLFEPAPNPRTRGGLADGQGVCLARAGRFDEAEEVLSAATATGTATAALWLRLGEVDMALGRLEDAITALDAALRVARSLELAPIHWMRAVAFDRARQPGDAQDAAETALKADLSMSWVLNRQLPSAPPEDFFYVAGLAYETGVETRPAQPERALLYFRQYVEKAAKSPWKKRAAEHVAALAPFDPASALTRPGARQGTSTLETTAIAKSLRKDLGKLASCMDDVPQSVAEVKVVIHGAPAKPKRGAPVVLAPKPPVAGVVVRMLGQVLGVPGPTTADTQAAVKCLETAAGKLKVAKLEKGTWIQLVFPVIAK